MDTIVYPFHRTALDTRRVVNGVIVIIVGLFIGLGGIFFVLPAIGAFASGHFSIRELIALGLMGILFCVGGSIVCVGCIVRIYFGSVPYEAVLTSDTFSFGRRGRVKTLRLSEITNISACFTRYYGDWPRWAVTIRDTHQRQIQLPVISALSTRKVLENEFDYQAILRDLQQRLPATAVNENVKNFITVGEFV